MGKNKNCDLKQQENVRSFELGVGFRNVKLRFRCGLEDSSTVPEQIMSDVHFFDFQATPWSQRSENFYGSSDHSYG